MEGHTMSPDIRRLRAYAACAESLPVDQDRTEVRILSTLLTTAYMISILEPIFYLVAVPQALISKVSALAPSIWCVAAAFALCLAATAPHLFFLTFRPEKLKTRWPRVYAAFGAFGACTTWAYLASLSIPMDLGGIEYAYMLRAVGSIVIGLTYGFSLNAQQLRGYLDASKCSVH